jgi:predicted dehydrogenase
MKRLKMAVVGVGALGQHHARILSQMDGVELVAVAENREDVGRAIAEKCNTRWVADYRDLLDEVDAASIVVPTSAHFAVASEFLRRGIPILLEKPLALTSDQGRVLVKLAQNHDAVFQVGHIERFNAVMTAARPLCGEPKYIRSERLSPFPFRSLDIGVVLDVMIHDIDLVLSMVDAPLLDVDAFGISVMGGQEDCVQARLTFRNGCVADLTASRINPTAKRAMQVWSPEGCVNIDFSKPEVIRYRPSDSLRFGPSPVERAQQPGADIAALKRDVFGEFLRLDQPEIIPCDALTAELASFIECVHTGATPIVDGRAGLSAMLVAERVIHSVEQHQWDGHAAGAIGPQGRVEPRRRMAG